MGSIVLNQVGKKYKRYVRSYDRLLEWLTLGRRMFHEPIWVLKGITFRVETGEAVGIVGQNGAGKSTLLKIIAGTIQPTDGEVKVQGRVAAILELGMGFDPEFTGRQNALLAGQILGFKPDEIQRLLPEIEAFARIGPYMDQPLRTYSSGMAMRLAFSVATAVRPDILIIDEALAVGDAAFQRKCLRRIKDYVSEGTTLLFVSHDVETVKKVCSRALFIKEGRMAHFGPAKQVCDEYEKYLFGGRIAGARRQTNEEPTTAPETSKFDPSLISSCEVRYGNGKADILSCWLEDADGQRVNVIEAGTPLRWCYRVRFNQDVDEPIFAMMLKTREGIALYGVDSKALGAESASYRSGELVDVKFSLKNQLAPGLYYLNCGVKIETVTGVEFLSRRVDSAILRVTRGYQSTVAVGLVDMEAALLVKVAETVAGV